MAKKKLEEKVLEFGPFWKKRFVSIRYAQPRTDPHRLDSGLEPVLMKQGVNYTH